jgi:hypothetical protein
VGLRVTLPLLIAGFGCTPPEGAARQPPLNIARNLLVANQSSSSATLIDLRSGTSKTIAVPDDPHETAISANGRVGIVTSFGGRRSAAHQLAVIDVPSGTVARIVPLGKYARPHGVAFLPGDNTNRRSQSGRTSQVRAAGRPNAVKLPGVTKLVIAAIESSRSVSSWIECGRHSCPWKRL